MKTLDYTSEATFITEKVEFSDEHYGIAETLHKQYDSEIVGICSPIMVRDDKKSLVFCLNLGDKNDRASFEIGKNKYKVIIEKI